MKEAKDLQQQSDEMIQSALLSWSLISNIHAYILQQYLKDTQERNK